MNFSKSLRKLKYIFIFIPVFVASCSLLDFSMQKRGEIERVCTPKILSDDQGYYVNKDGFYGYPHRVEYLKVYLEDDSLQALKLVGDMNVPRGKLSWKTNGEIKCASYFETIDVSVQLRINPSDPNGFTWESDSLEIILLPNNTISIRPPDSVYDERFLIKVGREEALKAEKNMSDHP